MTDLGARTVLTIRDVTLGGMWINQHNDGNQMPPAYWTLVNGPMVPLSSTTLSAHGLHQVIHSFTRAMIRIPNSQGPAGCTLLSQQRTISRHLLGWERKS